MTADAAIRTDTFEVACVGNSVGTRGDDMIEILRTNDLVLISVVSSLLEESGIAYFVADEHMSVLEGSAGFLQRRVMVERDAASRARRLLTEAGFGEELKRG